MAARQKLLDHLLADPSGYIFVWLLGYSGGLGSIAGVLIADYWFVRRTRLHLEDLYRMRGAYHYNGGWNWRAVLATLVGSVLAVGGAYGGPFPADGLIPFLKPLYDYNWVVGFVAGFLVFLALKDNTAKETTR